MKIIYVNAATEKLFGYKAEELIGENPCLLNAEPNAPDIQEAIVDTIRQGKVWRGEILNKKKNGDLFYIHATIYQLMDKEGNFIAMVGFQEDITEHKHAEEALRKAHGELELRVQERTVELAKSNEELQKEITERKKTEEALKNSETELQDQKSALEQKNIALREIVAQIETEKNKIKEDIVTNLEKIVLPLLGKMKLSENPNEYLDFLKKRFYEQGNFENALYFLSNC